MAQQARQRSVPVIAALGNELMLGTLATGLFRTLFDPEPRSPLAAAIGGEIYGVIHLIMAVLIFLTFRSGQVRNWQVCLWVMVILFGVDCITSISEGEPFVGVLLGVLACTSLMRIFGVYFPATLPKRS
ncbi:MAG: hypothetical protein AAGF24_00120 [Cyanobacteria bacterium P01_H01_bin.121]